MQRTPALELTLVTLSMLGLAGYAVPHQSASLQAHTRSRPSAAPPISRLPDYAALREALTTVRNEANGGLNLDMWATLVDRSGRVVAVAFTGKSAGDQWPGSRIISAQKANTANAFSLPKLALSTANLYSATQPGGSLFGLQESNPVDPAVAYGGDMEDFGTARDPMMGKRIGGINVFGGGVALYAKDGTLLGGLGVSGDASCADHIIAWKVRHRLGLDYVPGGVSSTGDDNIVYDIGPNGKSANGFGHPTCSPAATTIATELPQKHSINHAQRKEGA